ncbi:oxidoreductase, short-chain dehydrogenase/reductase family protein [marine gamma proteobacterium HTCC2080]|nr:oxidoreductase, short-chain dehydrogenase/reductase family protein [marine gamma proteobacterium HTCC2080]
MSFRGQVAVITGGGSGMGQAWARRLAEDGATVAILDVNEAGMAETAASASNIKPYVLDITDADAVASVFADIEASLGPVDRVANAAAIMPFGRLLEEDPKLTTRVMTINYGGLVNVATAALPRMIERGSGDFVSFSSMTGIVPGLLMGAYASSKAAVQFYTEILYHENRNSGLRFCCVCPPAVKTALWQQAEATVVPKLPSKGETLMPDVVIDEIERCLDKGKLFSYPGKQTQLGVVMRRLFPQLIWRVSHDAEGF